MSRGSGKYIAEYRMALLDDERNDAPRKAEPDPEIEPARVPMLEIAMLHMGPGELARLSAWRGGLRA